MNKMKEIVIETPKFANDKTISKGKIKKKEDPVEIKLNLYTFDHLHNKSKMMPAVTVPNKEIAGGKSSNLKPNPKQIADRLFYNRITYFSIKNFGHEIFSNLFNHCKSHPPSGFLDRHQVKLSERSFLVDWILQTVYNTHLSEDCFFDAINIMDRYLWKVKKPIESKDLKRIGIVCFWIASKTYEVKQIPLKYICHGRFSEKEIITTERNIIKVIFCDVWNNGSAFECIKFLLYDCYISNSEEIKRLKMKRVFLILENTVVYLIKLTKYNSYFSTKKEIHSALATLLFAVDVMNDYSPLMDNNIKDFFKAWLDRLVNGICKKDGEKKQLKKIYEKLKSFYTHKLKKEVIIHLDSFHPLFFV